MKTPRIRIRKTNISDVISTSGIVSNCSTSKYHFYAKTDCSYGTWAGNMFMYNGSSWTRIKNDIEVSYVNITNCTENTWYVSDFSSQVGTWEVDDDQSHTFSGYDMSPWE